MKSINADPELPAVVKRVVEDKTNAAGATQQTDCFLRDLERKIIEKIQASPYEVGRFLLRIVQLGKVDESDNS